MSLSGKCAYSGLQDVGNRHDVYSAGLSPRVAPCQNLRGGAHSTISVLIIEKS